MDRRHEVMKDRFQSLSKKEIKTILDNIDIVCFDTYNYSELDKKYCPIAIAMNLHNILDNPTDYAVTNAISNRFMPVNILKGVEGEFYTTNRKNDLIKLCNELL
jgi:hypothetical protein